MSTDANDQHAFAPGIRFSKLDGFILMAALVISAALEMLAPWFGIAVAFVVAHFFLFCNVVRMERTSELVWAAVFVILAGCSILRGSPGWPLTLAISFGATVLLVVMEMRKASYHCVFWAY